jgi:hypothetical protein
MGVYQKLLIIQQKVNGLGKDKKANSYSYVTGDKVLGEIKPMMNELGLLLKQEIVSIENTKIDYKTGIGTQYEKPKSEILSKVMMQFTWVDAETGEKDVNLFGANGQNDWDKGVGSALTYAERYFLLKFFHIATDQDDIDNLNREDKIPNHAPVIPPAKVATPKPVVAATPQVSALQPSKEFNTLTDKTAVVKDVELDKEKRKLLSNFVKGKDVPSEKLNYIIIKSGYKVDPNDVSKPEMLDKFIDNANNTQLKYLQTEVVAYTKTLEKK